jgi:hypothetical protein
MDSCGSDAGGDATRFIGTSQSDIKSERSEERRMQRGHAFGVYIVDADNFFALPGGSSARQGRPLVSLVRDEGRHR